MLRCKAIYAAGAVMLSVCTSCLCLSMQTCLRGPKQSSRRLRTLTGSKDQEEQAHDMGREGPNRSGVCMTQAEVSKRHAAQCDETADAPQPKRQHGEPKEPDCQQASEEAPTPPISAAPAPAVTEAPAAARDPSAESQGMLLMQSLYTPTVLLARREALPGELVAHSRSCPRTCS